MVAACLVRQPYLATFIRQVHCMDLVEDKLVCIDFKILATHFDKFRVKNLPFIDLLRLVKDVQ